MLLTILAVVSLNDSTIVSTLDTVTVLYGARTVPFEYIIRPYSKRWEKVQDGTFNSAPSDRGNYNGAGEFCGTNRSVAARTLEAHLGRKISKKDMINLDMQTAIQIYKKIYTKNCIDKMVVHQPLLVDMVYNAICSSNGSGRFKEVCRHFQIPVTRGGNIEPADILAFNKFVKNYENEKRFYIEYYNRSESYYKKRAKKHAGLIKWIKDYPTCPY